MEEKLKEQAVKFEEELKAVQLERDALRDGHRQGADEHEALKLYVFLISTRSNVVVNQGL